ncbi:MAG: C25 family cysteine peptidase, partial [Candidatus Bathyarchaeia archaeon]
MKGILILRVAFLLFTFSMISNFVSVPQVNLYNISPKLVSHSLESVGSLNNSVKTSSLLIKWSDVWAYYFKEHRAILGIPPDAEVIDVSIMNATFPDPNFHLYFSETFFRCYKVVCLEFQGGFNSRDDTFVNITYIPNRCSFYPVKYDELADTIAPKFLVNYEQAKWWKGFPVLSVNKTVSFMLPSDPKKYIIITKEEWVDSVMPLAKWKENKGLATYIASVEWINRTYMGASLPSKIKEFLKDAYNNWHFDYVVLTGGTNAIPTYYQFETAVPQDWYFVYLDEDEPPEWSRSWDFPEAIIGRLPAKTREELQAIVSKLVSYESNPLTGVWLQTGLEFYSWGFEDDYKFFEQHIVGNLTYKRYIYGYNLTMYPYQNNSFISAVNEGASFIFVDAHGTSEVMEGILNVSPNLIGLLENGPKLPVIFATSCSIAAFDLSPNLASELVSKSQGGAVLFFGKTRIGAEVPIDYQRLHDFLELANFRVGLMAFYARVIGNINPSNHILGDPEMSIWTIEPKLVSVYVPLKVLTGENIVVTITDL